MSVSSPTTNHSTGVSDSGRWSAKRIAVYALFVALTIVLSFVEFPILPGVQWLKYDPSGIVALVAGFAYGPAAAAIVSVLGFVPHVFTDPWGAAMAILVSLALSLPAALVYKRNRTRTGAVIGIIVGAVVAVVAAIGGNLVVSPFYFNMPVSAVVPMIVPILLPFNIIKMAIHGVVTFLIYKPISNLLDKRA
ncbi:ECF transporter S component [Bifidobacterium avesanii]|uniref:Riboflavin transporter n=1 Tax=Bifidobacterium avesanii TaxID=1798157 RepID=A0A7K3TFY3_9BIFI|nr:ECF transporter S component [Bifidobacterium avesanii]KAB8295595.1 ECF transporter, substrate-specific component [Bifidobacterium avesanii]NEG77599.1 ECF transporter S component [Bifidobacterium avesanii]